MRTLSRFLVLLLCLELIVSPIAPNFKLIMQNAHAEDCGAGMTFDTTLNRCLTKTETANVMNATMNCGNDKECYKENAKKAFMDNGSGPDLVEDKGMSGFVSKVAMTAAVAGATTYAVMALTKKTSGCKSPAFYGMIGGAVALVAGDFMANSAHAKRLKEIQEDWGKIVNPEQANGDKDKERETSIEAQSEAFEMLARSEDSLAEAAKTKKKFFMVATLAFGVTAAISAYEIFQNRALKTAAVNASKLAQTGATSAIATETTAQNAPGVTSATAASGLMPAAVAQVAKAAGEKEAADQSEVTPKDNGSAITKSGADPSDKKTETETKKVQVTQKMALASMNSALAAAKGSVIAQNAIKPAQMAMQKWEEHTRLTTCEDTGEDVKETPAPEVQAKAPPVSGDSKGILGDEAGAGGGGDAGGVDGSGNGGGQGPVPFDSDLEGLPDNDVGQNQNVPRQQGLFSYYIKPKSVNIKAELQAMYNLKHSTDMTSFVMNKWEMDGVLKSPVDEYDLYKDSLNGIVADKSVFETFKQVSLLAIEFMNPISFAHAKVEAEQAEAVDGGSGGGGGGTTTTSPTPGVNTKAAKTYKEVTAKGPDYSSMIVGVLAGGAMGFTGVGKKLLTSKGRLIFSGVLTAMTLMMANHAGSQAEASEKRAALLRKMKDDFKSASGAVYACKSADRNDPGKPNCYCYTAENQRNPNRGSSQICQKLWAGANTNINNLAKSNSSTRVCVNQNRQADASCSCKSNNTCMKVSLSGMGGFNPGTMSVLGNGLAPTNQILGGSIDGANLSPATLGSQIAKIGALNKALEKDPEIAKAKNSKAAINLQKALEKGGASLGGQGLLGSSGSNNMPSNPGDAARMLEKELKNANAPTAVGGNGGDFMASPAAPQENLEFGLTADQAAAQEGQIAEVMNKDLDYGANDINQASKTNIFEVLSNRYQRSGMRRLFDEKGETKPDAASKSDITQ